MKNALRTVAALAVTALVASLMSISLAPTPSANAATVAPTYWHQLKWTSPPRIYGTTMRFIGQMVAYNPNTGRYGYVPCGSVVLQFAPQGKGFRRVAADVTPSSYDLRHRTPSNGRYRLVYNGCNYNGYAFPSRGLQFSVPAMRKITLKLKKRARVVHGKVTPNWRRKKVFLWQSKHGNINKKWRKVKVQKTNRRGRYSFKLPFVIGTRYYVVGTPRKGSFVKSVSRYRVKSRGWRTYGRTVPGSDLQVVGTPSSLVPYTGKNVLAPGTDVSPRPFR